MNSGDGGGAIMLGASDVDDWRHYLMPEARHRIVNKIMDTLKRHLPISFPEGLSELRKIAVRFEEKIYAAATNQSDYLRKISLKMLSMETKTHHTTAVDPSHTTPVVGNQLPAESGLGVSQNIENHNVKKESKEPRKRKSKKQKTDLTSLADPNQQILTQQSIPSLLQQLIQAIAGHGQSSMPQPSSSLQQQSIPVPQQPIFSLQHHQETIRKGQNKKADIQSKLESSRNVIEDLSKCIPLLQNQLELERSSYAKIRSALDDVEIEEANARAQHNVSTAILQRELIKLSKAVATSMKHECEQ